MAHQEGPKPAADRDQEDKWQAPSRRKEGLGPGTWHHKNAERGGSRRG